MRTLDVASPPDARDEGETARAAAAELVGLHGDLDVTRAAVQAAWQARVAQPETFRTS